MVFGMELTEADERRFWSKIAKGAEDECWPWLGWLNNGYGRFDVGMSKILAHRLALSLTFGPPEGERQFALHGDCTNPLCCNPRHLRWGTKLENAQDRDRLGHRTALRGEAHKMVKLTEDQVRYIRASPLSQRKLAKELGVTQPAIGMIRRGINWSWLV